MNKKQLAVMDKYRTDKPGKEGIFASLSPIVALLISFSVLAALLSGCKNNNLVSGSIDMDMFSKKPMNESMPVSLEMSSGGSKIVFAVNDNIPYILSLTDSGGNEAVSVSELSLPLSVTTEGRSNILSWNYAGAERGDRCLNGVTSDVLRLSFTCSEHNLVYHIYCVVRDRLDGPFEYYSELQNNNFSDIRYAASPLFTATLQKNAGADPVAWLFKKESGAAEGIHIGSFYSEGTGIYKTTLKRSAKAVAWVNVFQNWNVSGYIPMMYIQYNSGHGIIFALEWSAGRVIAESENDKILLRADMNDVSYDGGTFFTKITPGETFLNPSVYLGVYTGDVDDGSNLYKNWFFNCKAPAKLREDENEPLTQMDMQSGLDVSDLGVESVKWDYGWWSDTVTSGSWRTLEGSWELRNKAYTEAVSPYGGTMRGFGLAAKRLGINWVTYGLLHANINGDMQPTDQYGEFNSIDHPDWFSKRCITEGMGNSADLGNTDCVEYLKKYMLGYITTNMITTWRSDFEPICYFSDKENRHDANGTDVQYWCTKGFLELVDFLYDNYDDFRYESCSSGGSMKDPIAATRTVVFNTDDSANYLSLRATFYDSSYCFCTSQLQLPGNPDCFNINRDTCCWPKFDSDQTNLSEAVADMGFRSMMLGVMSWGAWSGDISSYRSYYAEYYNLYRDKLRPLVRRGNLYHILPRPDGINWDGIMYAGQDAESNIRGAVFLFKPSEQAGDSVTVVLRGLDAGTLYTVEFYDGTAENRKAAGEELMTFGVTINIQGVGSEIIWLYA